MAQQHNSICCWRESFLLGRWGWGCYVLGGPSHCSVPVARLEDQALAFMANSTAPVLPFSGCQPAVSACWAAPQLSFQPGCSFRWLSLVHKHLSLQATSVRGQNIPVPTALPHALFCRTLQPEAVLVRSDKAIAGSLRRASPQPHYCSGWGLRRGALTPFCRRPSGLPSAGAEEQAEGRVTALPSGGCSPRVDTADLGGGAGAASPSPRHASFYSDAAPRPPPPANLWPWRRRPATRKGRLLPRAAAGRPPHR